MTKAEARGSRLHHGRGIGRAHYSEKHMNTTTKRLITTVGILLSSLAAIALVACSNPTAANKNCAWRYTAFKTVVHLDSIGTTAVKTSQLVPSDSVYECHVPSTYGAVTRRELQRPA
jgi:hypothetical protein